MSGELATVPEDVLEVADLGGPPLLEINGEVEDDVGERVVNAFMGVEELSEGDKTKGEELPDVEAQVDNTLPEDVPFVLSEEPQIDNEIDNDNQLNSNNDADCIIEDELPDEFIEKLIQTDKFKEYAAIDDLILEEDSLPEQSSLVNGVSTSSVVSSNNCDDLEITDRMASTGDNNNSSKTENNCVDQNEEVGVSDKVNQIEDDLLSVNKQDEKVEADSTSIVNDTEEQVSTEDTVPAIPTILSLNCNENASDNVQELTKALQNEDLVEPIKEDAEPEPTPSSQHVSVPMLDSDETNEVVERSKPDELPATLSNIEDNKQDQGLDNNHSSSSDVYEDCQETVSEDTNLASETVATMEPELIDSAEVPLTPSPIVSRNNSDETQTQEDANNVVKDNDVIAALGYSLEEEQGDGKEESCITSPLKPEIVPDIDLPAATVKVPDEKASPKDAIPSNESEISKEPVTANSEVNHVSSLPIEEEGVSIETNSNAPVNPKDSDGLSEIEKPIGDQKTNPVLETVDDTPETTDEDENKHGEADAIVLSSHQNDLSDLHTVDNPNRNEKQESKSPAISVNGSLCSPSTPQLITAAARKSFSSEPEEIASEKELDHPSPSKSNSIISPKNDIIIAAEESPPSPSSPPTAPEPMQQVSSATTELPNTNKELEIVNNSELETRQEKSETLIPNVAATDNEKTRPTAKTATISISFPVFKKRSLSSSFLKRKRSPTKSPQRGANRSNSQPILPLQSSEPIKSPVPSPVVPSTDTQTLTSSPTLESVSSPITESQTQSSSSPSSTQKEKVVLEKDTEKQQIEPEAPASDIKPSSMVAQPLSSPASAYMNTYKCLVCGLEGFQRFKDLRDHRTRVHSGIYFDEEKEKPFSCGICSKPFFLREDALVCASLGHNPTSLRLQMFRYACSQCPPERLKFQSVTALKRHCEIEHGYVFLGDEANEDNTNNVSQASEEPDSLPTVIIDKEEAERVKAKGLPQSSDFQLVVENSLIDPSQYQVEPKSAPIESESSSKTETRSKNKKGKGWSRNKHSKNESTDKSDNNEKDAKPVSPERHVMICPICNSTFHTHYALNNHMQEHTKAPKITPAAKYKCYQCPKTFVKLSALRFHFGEHLNTRAEHNLRSSKVEGRRTRGRPRLNGTLNSSSAKAKPLKKTIKKKKVGRPRKSSTKAVNTSNSKVSQLKDKSKLTKVASPSKSIRKRKVEAINVVKSDKRKRILPDKSFNRSSHTSSLSQSSPEKKKKDLGKSIQQVQRQKSTRLGMKEKYGNILKNPGFVLIKKFSKNFKSKASTTRSTKPSNLTNKKDLKLEEKESEKVVPRNPKLLRTPPRSSINKKDKRQIQKISVKSKTPEKQKPESKRQSPRIVKHRGGTERTDNKKPSKPETSKDQQPSMQNMKHGLRTVPCSLALAFMNKPVLRRSAATATTPDNPVPAVPIQKKKSHSSKFNPKFTSTPVVKGDETMNKHIEPINLPTKLLKKSEAVVAATSSARSTRNNYREENEVKKSVPQKDTSQRSIEKYRPMPKSKQKAESKERSSSRKQSGEIPEKERKKSEKVQQSDHKNHKSVEKYRPKPKSRQIAEESKERSTSKQSGEIKKLARNSPKTRAGNQTTSDSDSSFEVVKLRARKPFIENASIVELKPPQKTISSSSSTHLMRSKDKTSSNKKESSSKVTKGRDLTKATSSGSKDGLSTKPKLEISSDDEPLVKRGKRDIIPNAKSDFIYSSLAKSIMRDKTTIGNPKKPVASTNSKPVSASYYRGVKLKELKIVLTRIGIDEPTTSPSPPQPKKVMKIESKQLKPVRSSQTNKRERQNSRRENETNQETELMKDLDNERRSRSHTSRKQDQNEEDKVKKILRPKRDLEKELKNTRTGAKLINLRDGALRKRKFAEASPEKSHGNGKRRR